MRTLIIILLLTSASTIAQTYQIGKDSLTTSPSTYAQTSEICKDSLTNYSLDCDGRKLEIHVPCKYLRTDYFQYIEGRILAIIYPDSSSIRILCGANADISIQDNKTKGLHYKKVNVKGYQVIYEDVPGQKLRVFDKAFELLKTDIK